MLCVAGYVGSSEGPRTTQDTHRVDQLWASPRVIPQPAFSLRHSTSRPFGSTDAARRGLSGVWESQQGQPRVPVLQAGTSHCRSSVKVGGIREGLCARVTVTARTSGMPFYVILSIHTGKWMYTMDV